jgi:hypothetical protein
MTTDQDYHDRRFAAVACGVEGPDNCRFDWNTEHPDDVITWAEQQEFEVQVVAKLRGHTDPHFESWDGVQICGCPCTACQDRPRHACICPGCGCFKG